MAENVALVSVVPSLFVYDAVYFVPFERGLHLIYSLSNKLHLQDGIQWFPFSALLSVSLEFAHKVLCFQHG